jgi:hypothetical protein
MLSDVATTMFKTSAEFIQVISISSEQVCEQTLKKVCVKFQPYIWPEPHIALTYANVLDQCDKQLFTTQSHHFPCPYVLCEMQSKQQIFMYSNHMKSEAHRKVRKRLNLRNWVVGTEMRSAYWDGEWWCAWTFSLEIHETRVSSFKFTLLPKNLNMWMHTLPGSIISNV